MVFIMLFKKSQIALISYVLLQSLEFEMFLVLLFRSHRSDIRYLNKTDFSYLKIIL